MNARATSPSPRCASLAFPLKGEGQEETPQSSLIVFAANQTFTASLFLRCPFLSGKGVCGT